MPSTYRPKRAKGSKGAVKMQKKRRLVRQKKIAYDIISALKVAGCKACGEKHPACLDFHHRDPATKTRGARDGCVAQMAGRGRVAMMLAEIEKCDLICSNCHRKLHHAGRETS